MNNAAGEKYSISELAGKTAVENTIEGTHCSIDINNLPAGTYLIKIAHAGRVLQTIQFGKL